MKAKRKIELLAPARNADTGIEAIKHGADAVYIGASKFGARASASNSPDDIRRLAEFAHVFGAKVYVTLNTILYDSELEEVQSLARSLYDAGADAFIVQDAAFLSMPLPPVPLHASTQTDNRTPDKVCRLYNEGFDTVVLARELSLGEIGEIHAACPKVRLEAFVHGALCVSLSGRCYASQYCFGRSANRGECAQFCRLPFNLETSGGDVIMQRKHLLSLRDMNRSRYIEQMIDAGVSSFKIEGRLKDVSYVKNVTAFYRRRIDEVLARRDEYERASAGISSIDFEPVPEKSFNRGFTDYFLTERSRGMMSANTPKSTGEPVGEVKEMRRDSFTVAGLASFHNGDGLCFFDSEGMLRGFRVNRAEGNRLFPSSMPEGLQKHTRLFRNSDSAFERQLSKASAERRLDVDMVFSETPDGYSLEISDELGRRTVFPFSYPHEDARTPQQENLRRQLSRLGDTLFCARSVDLRLDGERFIPSSVLAAVRRDAVVAHMQTAARVERIPVRSRGIITSGNKEIDFSYNVANATAREFYRRCGATSVAPAYEISAPHDAAIMTCRFCLRHALGACLREKNARRLPSELYLRLDDGRRFRLEFDCSRCYMKVYAD